MFTPRDIVIEGPDNTGKSTLAQALANAMHLGVIGSEGPEKYPGEINERIQRYSARMDLTIFDRHPAVSEPIYGLLRGQLNVDSALLAGFYAQPHLFIYCHSQRGLGEHQVKGYDTPEHLQLLSTRHDHICHLYSLWALSHAHLVYRIGDDMTAVVAAVIGVVG